jgi:hypothetical protein
VQQTIQANDEEKKWIVSLIKTSFMAFGFLQRSDKTGLYFCTLRVGKDCSEFLKK